MFEDKNKNHLLPKQMTARIKWCKQKLFWGQDDLKKYSSAVKVYFVCPIGIKVCVFEDLNKQILKKRV